MGNLVKIKNQSSGAAIWTLNTLNEQGKITSSSFGSGASQTKTYTKFGFLDTKLDYLSFGTDFLFSYQFDERNGNLTNRRNESFGVFENFEYENDKLTSASATGGYLQEVDYDFVTKTNIKSKTGVGNYTYHPTKKHSVKNVENTADLISSNEQNIIFSEQKRAKEIFEGMYKAEFDYSAGAHRQSMKMMVTEDPNAANPAYNLSYTRYYLGEYEKEVRGNTTTEVCYISTPIGLSAAYVTENNISEMYYLHTDHLGSIIGVSNNIQQKIYEVSYDAWGKKRPVQFWFASSALETPPSWLWRGYTGHEHLDEFALINMNARLYDPILGRMLSPDNYVSDATNSQDYNRYTYCRNNPLKYTDPSGNFVQIAFMAVAMLGEVSSNYANGVSNPWQRGWSNATSAANGISNCMQYEIYNKGNTKVTGGLNPFGFGVSLNAQHTAGNYTYNGTVGLSFTGVLSGNASVKTDEWSLGIGVSGGKNIPLQFGGGISYFDKESKWGGSFGLMHYKGDYSQTTWQLGLKYDKYNISVTEDLGFKDKDGDSDKWRTFAIQGGTDKMGIGFNVFTNKKDPNFEYEKTSPVNCSKFPNSKGQWTTGRQLSSPGYFYLRQYGVESRIGMDSPFFADFWQNGGHIPFKTPQFEPRYQDGSSLYLYNEFYKPYTPW